MSSQRSVVRSSVLTDAVLVLVLVAAVCIPVWPGVFTVDSQAIQRAIRYSDISDWYAPLHVWGWALVDRAISAGAVFLLGVSAFVASLLALTRQLLSPRAARVTTGATVLFPPVYGLLGWVGRDVWFATAAVAVSATALRVHRRGPDASPWLLVGLIVFGAAAADARQNGIPFGIFAVSVVAGATVRRRRPDAALLFRAGAVIVSVALFWGGLLLAQRAVMTRDLNPEEILYASDLVAVSLRTGRPVLDASLFPAQDLRVLRARLAGLSPDAVVNLDPPIVRYDRHGDTFKRLWAGQWRRMLFAEPGPYLNWRARLYFRQLGITGPARSPYFTGSVLLSDGLGAQVANEFPGALGARNRVLSWTDGTSGRGSLLYTPLFYVVGAFGAIVVLGRRTGERRAALAFALVLMAMQGLLFFTAPASEFRFQYFQVVFGTSLFSVVLALQLQSRRNCRRETISCPASSGVAERARDAGPPADAARSRPAGRC